MNLFKMEEYQMRKISVLALFALFIGCANSPKDFKADALGDNEGVFFGKFSLYFDGAKFANTCNLIFTDKAKNEDTVLTTDESGFFVGKFQKGDTYLSQIGCTSGMTTKIYMFEESNTVKFSNVGNGKKTYVGNISTFFSSAEEYSNPAKYVVGGLFAGAIIADEAKENAKKVRFDIQNDIEADEMQFKATILKARPMKTVFKSLKYPKKNRMPASTATKIIKLNK
ncbi:hypothetical protein [Halobacteriovorax sp. RT-2-1]|uniref:hypothetical protein n=2 Tax=Halobacteriovorax TaxID=1652133 RepID=UPI00399AAD6F